MLNSSSPPLPALWIASPIPFRPNVELFYPFLSTHSCPQFVSSLALALAKFLFCSCLLATSLSTFPVPLLPPLHFSVVSGPRPASAGFAWLCFCILIFTPVFRHLAPAFSLPSLFLAPPASQPYTSFLTSRFASSDTAQLTPNVTGYKWIKRASSRAFIIFHYLHTPGWMAYKFDTVLKSTWRQAENNNKLLSGDVMWHHSYALQQTPFTMLVIKEYFTSCDRAWRQVLHLPAVSSASCEMSLLT